VFTSDMEPVQIFVTDPTGNLSNRLAGWPPKITIFKRRCGTWQGHKLICENKEQQL